MSYNHIILITLSLVLFFFIFLLIMFRIYRKHKITMEQVKLKAQERRLVRAKLVKLADKSTRIRNSHKTV